MIFLFFKNGKIFACMRFFWCLHRILIKLPILLQDLPNVSKISFNLWPEHDIEFLLYRWAHFFLINYGMAEWSFMSSWQIEDEIHWITANEHHFKVDRFVQKRIKFIDMTYQKYLPEHTFFYFFHECNCLKIIST